MAVVVAVSLVLLCVGFGVLNILIWQILFTFNDLTYLERRKVYITEVYLPMVNIDKTKFMVTSYMICLE